MVINNKTVVVYDIEIFPNCFHCCCRNTEQDKLYTFEISTRKNQLKELVDFFYYNNCGEYMFCGYNNKHYDDVVINYIIDFYYKLSQVSWARVCQSLFGLSNTIVNSEEGNTDKFKRWKYANYFESMDLLTLQFSSKLRVGLKEMQITMHYRNVQEYDGDFNYAISVEDIDKMIGYNINDVDSTTELLKRLKKDIELRSFIQKEYDINAYSMDSVKFGETLLAKKYCEKTGITKKQLEQMRSPMDYIPLKDVILPFIKYKNPKLQEVLEDMKGQVVYSKERKGYEKQFVISNTRYSIGVGGIHSINTPRIYVPNENEFIGHADVASMYPSFIVKYKWIPRHLGEEFWQVYSDIYHERIEAKHSGQKLKSNALKLTLNSVTGKMQQETSWMYDPFSVFKIRINGQLVLLMLVDRLLELGCEIIQVNTDGVMYIAKKDLSDAIGEAIREIEDITKLSFEADRYEAFYQYAVNDYFGVVEGWSKSHDPNLIEKKGMFITENRLGKGMAPVVIPKAVINYFLTKEPVSEYIKRQTDIKDFLMTQRVDKKFKVLWGNNQIQRISRWYASINGPYIYKKGDAGDQEHMLKDSGVTVLNTLDDSPIENRKINYRYYISEANKVIVNFTEIQLELF
jgi:hypothetical protein